uniref:Protein TMED8 n=2 Tax=Aceria tosichella TaxID=561515 RepID=A0A6G1S2Z3_9ACAR
MQTHEILFDNKLTNVKSGGTKEQQQQLSVAESNDNGNEAKRMMSTSESDSLDEDHKIKFLDWGFKVDRLFEVAYRFYKRNENKAFHLGFDERNRMNALLMQAKFGNFDSGKAPDIGVLDLVGKRRQHEWSLLNGMSKTEAMTKFICELDDICPIFKAHAEAVKISSGFESHHNHNSGHENNGASKLVSQSGDPRLLESSAQLPAIYSSLCKQTHSQFKSYAEKQHPGDAAKQKQLIASLQEQYYQQYISQIDPKQRDIPPNASQSCNQDDKMTSSTPSQPAISNVSKDDEASTNYSNREDGETKVYSKAEETTGSNSKECLSLRLDATKMIAVDEQAKHEAEELKQANMGDINGEEDNVQADISCEELNSESNFETSFFPTTSNSSHREEEQLSTPPTQRSNITTPSSHNEFNETSHQNLVETVKLGQNFDLPPIGMFESFPEPKLVQNPYQKSTPIDVIDNSLPNKAVQQAQEELKDKKIESDDKIAPSHDHQLGPDKVVGPETSVINGYDHNPLRNYDNHCNTGQDSAHIFLPIPTEYNESDQNENYQPEAGTTNMEDVAELESQPPSNNHPDPSDQQVQQAPEEGTWDQQTGSSEADYSPLELQPTFNYEPLEPATIWTKRAVAEFKDSLSGDKQGGVYEIKEGALIVIQVPTYPDGRYIYWEFATNDYDIGFGVDFVHDKYLSEPLALNIYQDNDDDDLDELLDVDNWQGETNLTDDPEYCQSGIVSERSQLVAARRQRLANTVPILPTYRRDSHEEVFVGRHKYPGRGYYLLKFDNTYSVLRSKTLYFRICYFM